MAPRSESFLLALSESNEKISNWIDTLQTSYVGIDGQFEYKFSLYLLITRLSNNHFICSLSLSLPLSLFLLPGRLVSPASAPGRHTPFTNNRRPMCTRDLALSWCRQQIRVWSRAIWATRGCRRVCASRRVSIATSSSCRRRKYHVWAARVHACVSSRSHINCPSRTFRSSTASIWRCSTRPRSKTLWRRAMRLRLI